MSIFGFLKKKRVPSELPDLAMDEIRDGLEKDKDVVEKHLKDQDKWSKTEDDSWDKPKEKKNGDIPKTDQKEEGVNGEDRKNASIPKKSFFDDLQKHITEEIDNLDGLEDWYENKFMPQDIVSNMRNYWEDQKTNSVIEILGKNFKDRINEKTTHLQSLEREWQNIYFDLIEKEEEIKDEEEELKRILSEFVELCKRKKKGTKKDNGQKKEKKSSQKKTS